MGECPLMGGEIEAGRIPAERESQILETAERLGYRPRKKRRVKGRDKLFVFVSSPLGTHHERSDWLNRSVQGFYARLYEQVHLAALERGYSTMHYPADRIEELTRWLSEWDVSGVFWNHSSADLLKWVAPRFPVVQLERSLLPEVDTCMADQSMATQLAVEHLHEQGHRRIGYISKIPTDDYSASVRLFSLDFTGERLGMEIVHFTQWMSELIDHLRGPEPITALIAPDLVCFGVLQLMAAAGLSCPDDLSLIGVDNFEACDYSHPTLTSVDLNFTDTANAAFELLLARIGGDTSLAKKVLPLPRLIRRGSVRNLSPELRPSVLPSQA